MPEITQVAEFPDPVSGAGSSDLCSGPTLARRVWGEPCQASGSSLVAFAYLWRRFGPPWQGCDDHKDLAAYVLTTPDPEVWLWLHLGGSRLDLGVGYYIAERLEDEFHAPLRDWHARFIEWSAVQGLTQAQAYGRLQTDAGCVEAEEALGKLPRAPFDREKQRAIHPVAERVEAALTAIMQDLLRPVFVRDQPLNLFGPLDSCRAYPQAVERSIYAGYGVPKTAMDALLQETMNA